MPVQFSGESPWDAIVNSNALDIEEEDAFLQFIQASGCSQEADLENLERLYGEWRGQGEPTAGSGEAE